MEEIMTSLKESVIQVALERQRSVVQDFRQRIKDATANDGNVNEEEYDNQKQAFQAQVLAEVSLLNEQLQVAERDLAELEKMGSVSGDREGAVGYGNLVKTDKRTFFISTGIEDFLVQGQMISGVSTHSPIYHAMCGKHAGDTFMQSGIQYSIREVL
jgi:hypothetical protein